jgi:hypothetical protein
VLLEYVEKVNRADQSKQKSPSFWFLPESRQSSLLDSCGGLLQRRITRGGVFPYWALYFWHGPVSGVRLWRLLWGWVWSALATADSGISSFCFSVKGLRGHLVELKGGFNSSGCGDKGYFLYAMAAD